MTSQKKELKSQIKNLFENNQEIILETLNEYFLEEWENDQNEIKDDLLIATTFNSEWVEVLKNKISQEIGSQYTQDLAKFSTLLGVYAQTEILEEATGSPKAEAIESNPKAMDGLKEIVKNFNENNSW